MVTAVNQQWSYQCCDKPLICTAKCHYNAVQLITILFTVLWWQQNLNQTSNSQQTPHTSPSRASYGESIVRICEKIDCIITALHCIWPKCNIFASFVKFFHTQDREGPCKQLMAKTLWVVDIGGKNNKSLIFLPMILIIYIQNKKLMVYIIMMTFSYFSLILVLSREQINDQQHDRLMWQMTDSPAWDISRGCGVPPSGP